MTVTTYSGQWIHTFTGKRVDPFNMKPEDVEIEHIAHALSTINRFCGSAREPYSVAQHSLLVEEKVHAALTGESSASRAWGRKARLWALLHDAPEAFGIPDVARPVKGRVTVLYPAGGSNRNDHPLTLKVHEGIVMGAICKRYGLVPIEPPIVKRADNRMVVTEARDLMAAGTEGWEWDGPEPEPYPERISTRAWWAVKDMFLERFRELQL